MDDHLVKNKYGVRVYYKDGGGWGDNQFLKNTVFPSPILQYVRKF